MEFGDLISGCKLLLVLILMQPQYLMYVIVGLESFVDPRIPIKNQVLLFGGIIKEAERRYDTDCIWPVESIIKDYYVDIYKELENHLNLPVGSELSMYKEEYTPIIKEIATGIGINLKDSHDWDF